jgi:hypothetical protein
MNKNRLLISLVLTTGLGLTGVVSASASDAAASRPARATTAVAVGGITTAPVVVGSTHGPGSGPTVFCFFAKGAATKGAPSTGKPTKTTVKIVNGKVYINGKRVPASKLSTKCPVLIPAPPAKSGGTGVGGSVGGGAESGTTTARG